MGSIVPCVPSPLFFTPTQNSHLCMAPTAALSALLSGNLSPGAVGNCPGRTSSMIQSDFQSGPHPGSGFRTRCHSEMVSALPGTDAMLTLYDTIIIVQRLGTTCVRILTLSCMNSVTLGKFPNLSGPQLSHQEVEIIKLISCLSMLIAVCGTW